MGAGVIKSQGQKGRRRRRSTPMAEINVTPFVDVMLVLLIIFMVSAPMLTVGVPVELPKTAANSLPSDQEEPLTVTLTAEGQILIQSAEIEENTLIAKLSAVAAERQNDKIFLRADGAIPYERVVQVMGALNAGGFSNIGLVTDVGGPAFDGSAARRQGHSPQPIQAGGGPRVGENYRRREPRAALGGDRNPGAVQGITEGRADRGQVGALTDQQPRPILRLEQVLDPRGTSIPSSRSAPRRIRREIPIREERRLEPSQSLRRYRVAFGRPAREGVGPPRPHLSRDPPTP